MYLLHTESQSAFFFLAKWGLFWGVKTFRRILSDGQDLVLRLEWELGSRRGVKTSGRGSGSQLQKHKDWCICWRLNMYHRHSKGMFLLSFVLKTKRRMRRTIKRRRNIGETERMELMYYQAPNPKPSQLTPKLYPKPSLTLTASRNPPKSLKSKMKGNKNQWLPA